MQRMFLRSKSTTKMSKVTTIDQSVDDEAMPLTKNSILHSREMKKNDAKFRVL